MLSLGNNTKCIYIFYSVTLLAYRKYQCKKFIFMILQFIRYLYFYKIIKIYIHYIDKQTNILYKITKQYKNFSN